ncbi:TetR family transcriptional regulator [Actinocatenispora rupis]|uniref:TetR family transcriptional regulator n=2 Tax=Actinocatenispora rupis TaxID=519421 RepID=A0A8J3JAF1_9ACTN|nr:TetR family transcriptional regulator [Actinocatenispora rupis]
MGGMKADPPAAAPGLRERKKLRTRRSIQHHALRLFAAHGYEQTTVEQIAAAAEVSPSTFFRYYPTKEDVVLSDEYDPMLAAAVRDRPADEKPLLAVHNAMMSLMPQMVAETAQDTRERMRLALSVPALRGRIIQGTAETTRLIAGALAERAGRRTPEYEDEAVAAAYVGVAAVAMLRWAEADHELDPGELLERAVTALRTGL